jgi:acetyl-CoA synthetase (ADP-forming)
MYEAMAVAHAESRSHAYAQEARQLIAARRSAGDRAPHEFWSKQIISRFGVSVPAGRLVLPGRIDEMKPLAGGPFAIKFMSSQVQHKSDLGAVRLNVPADQVAAACHELLAAPQLQHITCEGLLVEEMAAAGVELMLGGVIDPSFGPLVMLGTGGTLVELLDDVALRLCPLDEVDARAMLQSLRISRLLAGYRGSERLSTEAVVEAVLAVGGPDGLLMQLSDDVAEVDVNPLIVGPTGAVAADAQLVLSARGEEGTGEMQ